MSRLRRFEILLPKRFNDGTAIPDEFFGDSLNELRSRFGAASLETQIIRGQWEHSGQIYRDEVIRVFVDVPRTRDVQQFFFGFKETLKARFQQIEVWITAFEIERI